MLIELEDWEGNTTSVAVNNFIIGTEFFKSVNTGSKDNFYFRQISGLESSMEALMESLGRVCLRKEPSSALWTETMTPGARIVREGFYL